MKTDFKYISIDSIDNMDLLKVYSQYNTEYTKTLNTIHMHSKLVKKNNALKTALEQNMFKSILDYMAFYSIKHSIGIELLKRVGIGYKDIVDVLFFSSSETFTVIYI